MRLFLLTSGLLLSAAVLRADVWTYADCVDYARAHNITLQKSRLNEQSAEINLAEAKAQWEPSLDFSTSQGVGITPFSTGSKASYSSSYGLNAGWTVWNGGEREKTIERRTLQTQIDRLSTDQSLRTLETDILQVYLNILYARESIGIYEAALALSEAQADRARQLMESGRLSRVDYAQLSAQADQDRYNLVNARGTYDTRRMELKKLLELGLDADIEPQPVDWTDQQILAALPSMDESYNLALTTDLQLKSLEISDEAARLDVEIAKASGKPSIAMNAGVGIGYNLPGQPFGYSLRNSFGPNLGVTLSIPIADRKKTQTAVALAQLTQLDNNLDTELRHTELAQAVESWYIDTQSAQARYQASIGQLSSAALSDELTNEQFKLGLVNTVELMTAHKNLIEAQYTQLQAKYMTILGKKMIEYYRTATISLN